MRAVPHAEPSRDTSRELLLAAAKRLFSAGGIDGTTVREIASRAGVNVCLVSYYFGGKEGLYRACLEEFGRRRVTHTQALLDSVDTREELRVRLKLIIEEILNAQAEDMDCTRILLREIDTGLPHSADVFEATFLKVTRSIIAFFEEGQRKGLVNPRIDPLHLTLMIQGFISHLTRVDTIGRKYFQRTITEPAERERVVDSLLQLFMNGGI